MSRLISTSGIIGTDISYVAVYEDSKYQLTVVNKNNKLSDTHYLNTVKGITDVLDSYEKQHMDNYEIGRTG